MKRLLPFLLAAFGAAIAPAAAPLTLDAGLSYVLLDPGARKVSDASYAATRDSETLPAPFVRLSMPLHSDWSIGLTYSYYRIRTAGAFAWDVGILDANPGLQALMQAWQTEDMHEAALDVRYHRQIAPNLHLEAGPVLSSFWSRTRTEVHLVSTPLVPGFVIRDDDGEVTLGGTVALRYTLSDNLTATLGYRYGRSWGRDMHLFSGGMGFSF